MNLIADQRLYKRPQGVNLRNPDSWIPRVPAGRE